MLANRFNPLPESPHEPEPVSLHTGAFLAVSKLISEIGKLKDRALWTEEMVRSSEVVGTDPKKALVGMGEIRLGHAQVISAVRKLVDRVIVKDGALTIPTEHLDAPI